MQKHPNKFFLELLYFPWQKENLLHLILAGEIGMLDDHKGPYIDAWLGI